MIKTNLELTDVPNQTAVDERWDTNASTRLTELASYDDPAYRSLSNLITAEISDLVGAAKCARILDVGCGVGALAAHLATLGHSVTAIDSSLTSIKEAANHYAGNNVVFTHSTLHELVKSNPASYEIVVANMTLHCVPNLMPFLKDIETLLDQDGYFIATLPNPRTYLQTREDIDVSNVDLLHDVALEIPFRIRNHPIHPARVFYFHRPVRKYTQAAAAAGLTVADFVEPSQVGPGRPRDVILIVFQKSLSR